MKHLLKITALALVSLASVSSHALVVGTAAPDTGNCYPFGCISSDWGGAYEQVYASSQFSGPTSIYSLSFFNTSYNSGSYQLNTGNYSIYLSTTSAAVNGLSSSPLANLGPDETLVYSGTLPTNASNAFGGEFDFLLNTTFSYDPSQGNLLMFVTSNTSSSSGIYLDYDDSGQVSSRLYNGNTDTTALVTGFDLVGSATPTTQSVPEPMSLLLVGAGLAAAAVAGRRARR